MGIESALISAGISAAVGLGSSLLINALTPAQTVRTGGLGDLSVPKSSYGAVIPQCWGQVKQSGILLHSAPLREITETNTQSAKGGPRVRTEEVTRFGSFAVLLAYCPHRSAEALKRLWLNDQLVFDGEATDPDTQQASAEFLANHLRFYTGSFDQPVDPFLQNAVPVQAFDYGLPHDPIERANALTALGLDPNLNHIPAYRFKSYIVIENLDLTPYNGQLPTVKAEVLYNSDNSLETIVTDLCNQAQITNIDTSGIQDIFVPGFYLDSQTTAKEALKTLQQAYFFDIIKSGKTYKFVRHSVDRDVIDIPLQDLAAHQAGTNRPVTFRLPQPDLRDLPRSIEVNYIDQEGGFESGNVISRSQIATSRKKETYTFPLVMTAEQAQQIADNLLYRFYLEAIKPPSLQLPPKYGYLEVGDRLNIAFYGEIYQLQITKIQTGANRLLKLDTKVVQAANINSIAAPTTPISSGNFNPPVTGSQNIPVQGDTTLEVLDINLIRDADADLGIYLAAYGGANWRSASLFVSNDDSSYFPVGNITRGTVGTLASPLDANSSSFLVALDSGGLVSVSDNDLDLGLNKLLVGDEILQFRDRALNGNNQELSNLVRGLRGTESFINSHSIGERVVLLTGERAAITRIPINQNDLGQVRYIKAPSPGQTLADAIPIPVTVEGNSLKPYSPVNAEATVDNANNISIGWQRRDRKAGDSTTYVNLPLSEFEEKYEIEIINGATVVRTETINNANYFYSRDNQINDFGSVQSSVAVRVYQISATVGRGYVGEFNLTPTFAEAAPIINNFSPASAQPGATVTVTGFALSGITSLAINGIAQNNLAVVNDNEISFAIATGTTTGSITLTTPGGTTTSTNELIIETASIPAISEVVPISSNTTIIETHNTKLLAVDTSAGDVTITIDETLLSNSVGFTFLVQNFGNNRVIFAGSGSNTLNMISELTQHYQGIRVTFITPSWYGF